MSLTPKQQTELNNLWDRIKSGAQDAKVDAARAMIGPGGVDVLPIILCDETYAQIMSVPKNDGTDRDVYARKPAGPWVQLP